MSADMQTPWFVQVGGVQVGGVQVGPVQVGLVQVGLVQDCESFMQVRRAMVESAAAAAPVFRGTEHRGHITTVRQAGGS
jgi:hypothetical protein